MNMTECMNREIFNMDIKLVVCMHEDQLHHLLSGPFKPPLNTSHQKKGCLKAQVSNKRLAMSFYVGTWVPWAAGPETPASRTSSAAAGAAGGPRHPVPGCSAAAAAGGGSPRTAPAGSARCSPAAAGCWPLPAAGPVHAGKTRRSPWFRGLYLSCLLSKVGKTEFKYQSG